MKDWSECFWKIIKQKGNVENEIGICNAGVNYFPIYYSVWGIFTTLLMATILIFKKTEDYIAKYS